MAGIIWIASYPKSGNTWVRLFLTNLILNDPGRSAMKEAGRLIPFENMSRFYEPFLGKPIAEASVEELAAARPQVHRMLASRSAAQLLKTHCAMGSHCGQPTISLQYTAAAIYIIRNPLDIVVSYAGFRNLSLDDSIALVNLKGRLLPKSNVSAYQYIGSWHENVTSWCGSSNDGILVIRYEDLVANPLSAFARIAKHLKMAASEEQIARAVDLTRFERLQETEAKEGFAERPQETRAFFRSGTSGQWHSQLTKEQIEKVVEPNLALMRRFGYWDDEASSGS